MNKQKQPFFLYYASHNVHYPITPHPYFHGKSGSGLRGDFVEELDWSVGQLISAVERFDAWDNTIFIFTSDNGAVFNPTSEDIINSGHTPNGKLKGKKFGVGRRASRSSHCLLAGKIPADTRSDALIANMDLLPTFAAITDQKLTPNDGRDAVNQLPLFVEEARRFGTGRVDYYAPHAVSHLFAARRLDIYSGCG